MRIAIVALSPIGRDARVLRTVRALSQSGHEVHVLGYGPKPLSCSGHFYSLGEPPTRIQHWAWVLAGYVPSSLSQLLRRALTTLRPLHRRCQRLIRAIRPDAIHANDWPALPIALWGKQATGARIIYDSHEFAREEHSERRLWRILCRPHVCAIEAAGVREAHRVVTIGPGIARLLAKTYSLAEPPLVVLNVPEYHSVEPHAIGERLELLYHGLLTKGRGIETLIAAMAEIRRPARLVLRGNGASRYVAGLRRFAALHAAPEKIVFESAVPLERVIESAARADIGLFAPPLVTSQVRFMLPNKLFEYLMAGLMVVFSNAEDVAEIVDRYECGVMLSDATPSGLAAAIDVLSLEEIRRHKLRARSCARSLCWEKEQEKLTKLYAEIS
jgi:glycosyltransferase involved in cell wall biosynthesis